MAAVAFCAAGCAFSGAAASAASAAQFHAENAPATLTGGQKATHVFTTDAGTITCTTASFPGSATSTVLSTVRVAPSYSGCSYFGWVSAEVHMNGCEYEFTSPSGSGSSFTGDVGIVCPEGKEILVTASGTCTTRFAASPHNSDLGRVTYTNLGSGTGRKVLVESNVSGIEYSQSGFLCATENGKTNGTYTGSTEESAKNRKGGADGIWIE